VAAAGYVEMGKAQGCPNKEVVNLEQFRVLTWTATFKKFMNNPCPGSVEICWKRSWSLERVLNISCDL